MMVVDGKVVVHSPRHGFLDDTMDANFLERPSYQQRDNVWRCMACTSERQP